MQKAMKKYFPIFVLPTAIAFIRWKYCAIYHGILFKFLSFTTVNDAKFVGLSNYVKAFTDSTFLHSMLFSALFTIVTVILINVFAFLIALALTSKIRGTTIFRTVFFMPNLIGGIVLGYIWQLLLNGILAHWKKH